jgi:hypothetical protein
MGYVIRLVADARGLAGYGLRVSVSAAAFAVIPVLLVEFVTTPGDEP